MKWITASNLQQLASTNVGASIIPELVRRLIRASSNRIEHSRFPSGDSVYLPGWDGELVAAGADPYVPNGISVWELSADANPPGKAKRDFDKRCSPDSPALNSGHSKSEATYVAVTMRRWAGKGETTRALFLKGARARKVWKDVRIIDAVDLEDWIAQCPSVGVWFARDVLNQTTNDMQSLEGFWKQYAIGSRPYMNIDLLLCDRENSVNSLIIDAESQFSKVVQADSASEAAAFVAAAFLSLDPSDSVRNNVLSKGLVISKKESVDYLQDASTPLYIVVMDQAADLASVLSGAGHHVIAAFGNSHFGKTTVPRLRLERARRHSFAEKLQEMGLKENEASARATECNASITIFRRITDDYSASKPSWANHETLKRLLGPILCGAWSHADHQDQEIVATLGGVPYGNIENVVAEFLMVDDPPIQRAGRFTALNAPADILQLSLGLHVINIEALERLEICALLVLGEIDPAFELPSEQRGYSEIYGKKRQYSSSLRKGLAEMLRLVAIHGQSLSFPNKVSLEHYFDSLVEKLPGLATDYRMLASLDSQLPALFEVAPLPFLKALENLSSGDGSLLSPIFEGSDDMMFGRVHYLGVLRSVEMLAWDPTLLGRATKLLARLAELDPGGKISNRPINSLTEIFLPWNPHTNASSDMRRRALLQICNSHPGIGWKLLSALFPDRKQISTGTTKPEWREFGASQRSKPNGRRDQSIVIHLAISLVGLDPERWLQLIDAAARNLDKDLTAVLERLNKDAIAIRQQQFGEQLWEGLRKLLAKNRSFSTAKWAISSKALDRIEEAAKQFSPVDLVTIHQHLFDRSSTIYLVKGESNEQRSKQIDELRDAAFEVIADGGIEKVLQLSSAAKDQGLIADSLIRTKSPQFATEMVLSSFHGNVNQMWLAAQIIGAGIRALGEEWAMSTFAMAVKQGGSQDQMADLLILWPDTTSTFNFISSINADIEKRYWEKRDAWVRSDCEETILYAIAKIKAANRNYELINYVGGRASITSTGIMIGILEASLCEIASNQSNVRKVDSFWLEEIFKELQKRTDINTEALVTLEYSWLPALFSYTEKMELALHKYLAESPEFFVQILSDLYMTESQSNTVMDESDDDYSGELDEGGKARAKTAYQILDSWRHLPWRDESGQLDLDAMIVWTKSAIDIATKCERGSVAGSEIGKVLAHAPVDPIDNLWPVKEVRNLIEAVDNTDIERGILIELFNKRGVTVRSSHGGSIERKLADEASSTAIALQDKWPRTAMLMQMNAEQWRAHAKWEDDRASESKLRI